MFEYMPREYADYRESMAMVQAEAGEFEKLNDKVRDVLDQFFIDTATWGLANWERIFGIVADESKPLEQRRSVIKSKLRGYGTVTAAFIKNVAESFENGAVDVVEDAANYTVKITFIDTRGVPGNLDDIKKALRDIIPAHLAISFEFTYLRWSEFDAKNYTWSTLEAKALTWDQFERLK
ncbi:phage portal protein [Neobacillus mesonae]|uniref:Phage portal protein n=2 Tax=Neobacillus mesonae TaxID=1193713 RepID=A0A3T0I685_9BACI|nr:phage portal protein [Neobacillus mesonae]